MAAARGAEGPLAGLRVLEIGGLVAAPFCGKLLADLGADVLKMEPPGGGDPARRCGPFPEDRPHPERSGLFLYLNTNKRAVTLDLSTQGGRAIFLRLVDEADALIEDTGPGELERLGIDPKGLSARRPRLVHTSITPFGATGPQRDFRAHPLNVYHSSPHKLFSAGSEGAPRRAPPPSSSPYLADYDAGLTAALGTLAALLGARVTGRGQRVEVSKREALLCLERVDIGLQINPPKPPTWRGSVGGLLKANDGYVMVTPVQDHQWQGLVRAMGNPAWAQGEACKDEVARQAHRDEIQPRIQAWAGEHSRDEIYRRLQAEGTPAGPVFGVAEVRDWPQMRAREFFVDIDHPEAGKQTYPSMPYRFDGSNRRPAPAPLLGEHNEEVYCEWLGYSRADLTRLRAAGVI